MNKTIEKLKNKLTLNEIFKASEYFESIEDFVNIQLASKKFRGLTEMYKYNPVSLNAQTKKIFPNVETLHLYTRKDKKMKSKKINNYCIWYDLTMQQYEKEYGNICKSVKCTEKDGRGWFSSSIPKGATVVGTAFLLNDKYTEELTIPEGVTKLETMCFMNAGCLTDVEFPTSIVRIAGDAFDRHSLVNLTIPKSWTLHKDRMFNNLPYLQSFDVGEYVEEINGEKVTIEHLTSYEVPTYVTRLGEACFAHSWYLTKITIPTSVISLESRCFAQCCDLEEIVIPSSVTSLGNECFWRCCNLKKIVLPETLISIGDKCFEDCTKLTDINIPKSVETWGRSCFWKCKQIEKLYPDIPHCYFISYK